jgi:tryptophan 2,3-dioxygenase
VRGCRERAGGDEERDGETLDGTDIVGIVVAVVTESAAEDYAQPILAGKGASDYERYLRTDELLALQKAPEEMVHRDELLFQTTHQSSELWLKLSCFEVEEATRLIREEQLAAAIRLLRRATRCLELVATQIHMLEHMSPWEYQEIRRVLGHGSGFDSPGFNGVRRVSPELGEAFGSLLRSRDLTIIELYQRGRELEDLYQLAELLIEWDERVILWRVHHFKLVERVIGGEVVGTQGTPVELLGKLIHHRYYPELWHARNRLTELAKEQD